LKRPELFPPRLLVDGRLRDCWHFSDLLSALTDDRDADLLAGADRRRQIAWNETDRDAAFLSALHERAYGHRRDSIDGFGLPVGDRGLADDRALLQRYDV